MNIQAHKPILIGGALALLFVGVLAFKDLPNTSLLQRTVIKEDGRLPKGTVAPDFQLPNVKGQTMKLEDFKGEVSLLIFVSPTCPYCKQLKEALVNKGIPDLKNRLGFITTKSRSSQELSKEVQELEVEIAALFPVLQDSAGAVFEAYRTAGVPTSYLLDKEGKVIDSAVGAPESLKLAQKLVDQALAVQSDGCDSCQ